MNRHHAGYFKIDFLEREISKDEDFKLCSEYFSLLSDVNRLKIFWLLCHSRECVQNIATFMNMSNPAVSHHLKLLKESELIESYRDGKEVYYSASKSKTVHELHKIIENLMTVTCPDFDSSHEKINLNAASNSEYLDNQAEKIRKVHDYLMENLSKRITIEELSKEFAINPTTLKIVFKDVYGSSIASHIKEHRMEKAAQLLTETDKSVSQIASEVGYESQSKFGAAFREFFNVTPVEYKNKTFSSIN